MIQKPLDAISEDDLLALISNGVREGRAIDYKRELPGNSDGEKKEFLADVSSFANTSGGDLVFGIDEAQGLPTQLTGVRSANADLEIRRLDSILASGLDPRIRCTASVDHCAGEREGGPQFVDIQRILTGGVSAIELVAALEDHAMRPSPAPFDSNHQCLQSPTAGND